jgi:hypothetical protein
MHHYEARPNLVVVDESRNEIGTVVEIKDNVLTIDPLHPDLVSEWEVECQHVRVATPLERMKAKVAIENHGSLTRPRSY